MKRQELLLLAGIVVTAFTVGCATTGKSSTAGWISTGATADAIIQINGLS